jgi:hypothetical protein
MKKAKFMLTAIMALAVVGGALAFKAKKFGFQTVYTTTAASPNASSICNVALSGLVTTIGSGGTPTWATTIGSNANCASMSTTTQEGLTGN